MTLAHDLHMERLERAKLERRIAHLESCLGEAVDMVEFWAAYASDYLKDKHGLTEDIGRLNSALGAEGVSLPPPAKE